MTEIIFAIIGVFFFALTLGFIMGETLSEMNRKRAEVKVVEEKTPQSGYTSSDTPYGVPPSPQGEGFKEEIDPMMLRNGFGVTRDRNPTFAEQYMNILNYNGESQTEGDYEESGNDAAEDMG
ncbi:MAG: hypothetical protein IJ306_05380 [Oscillospiraceae bacterium]|nr:hypothetical protein [Oscillospiraceae bacterium]